MDDLPPIGTVVWMKTHAKPVRARLMQIDYGRLLHVVVTLQFDDARYQSMNGCRRQLYASAFWSALDHVEGA